MVQQCTASFNRVTSSFAKSLCWPECQRTYTTHTWRCDPDHAASQYCVHNTSTGVIEDATQIGLAIDGRSVGYIFHCADPDKTVIFKGCLPNQVQSDADVHP